MLLAATGSIAAIALSAGGASAQEWTGHRSGAFVGVPEGSSAAGRLNRNCAGNRRCDFDRRGQSDVVMDWYGGDWARWNNRSWEATSYNDWWHEEPWRAYPAWMRRNQDCARRWYAGDTLSC
jgi:hypothetical protein